MKLSLQNKRELSDVSNLTSIITVENQWVFNWVPLIPWKGKAFTGGNSKAFQAGSWVPLIPCKVSVFGLKEWKFEVSGLNSWSCIYRTA
ncbi:hypothetical protein L3X38_021960 [Prunus dulcis]|uniref:Uncharacterized protein n=1 Tax=Prunus dulcis TaxID=3755 RepID=A0AAD4VWP0_PRUDU|nr:hypothetical protein L3X38_021960 [Prunus dulcis]